MGEESNFHDAFGVYADGVSEKTAVLPQGWKSRLVKIQNENTNDAIGWCLDPTDLAVAKHIAGRQKDDEFTAAMVEHDLLDIPAFRERIDGMDIAADKKAIILGRLQRHIDQARKKQRG